MDKVAKLFKHKEFTFKCQNFEETIKADTKADIIYCDPPYIDRHVDYYNGWNGEQEQALFNALFQSPSLFILSTWHHNDYRKDEHIKSLWSQFYTLTREHFYHVGGSEKNRNHIIEAIVTNYEVESDAQKKQEQLRLL